MTAVPEMNPMINGFKRAVIAREPQLGIWSSLTSNLLAEILGDAGFDWILFDTGHAPNDLQQLISQLQAIRGTTVHAAVRPAANDPVLIKRVLDIGFRNVLVPFVQTAGEAARAVAATRYPPRGIRGVSAYQRNNGYGRVDRYFELIDDNITVAVQIETKEAIANLETIAATPGVDAIFVGPGDLAAALGIWAKSATPMYRMRSVLSAPRHSTPGFPLASWRVTPRMRSAILIGDLLS